MKKWSGQKNRLHKKLSFFLGIFILIMAVGCQQTSEKETTPTPSIEIEQEENKTSKEVGQDKNQEVQQVARIHFIDTGNSDAILIEQGEHAALIDGGDNNDEALVVAYIQQLGIERLDYVFATHPDADHIGGLDAVLEALEVDHVFVGNGQAESKTYSDFIEAITAQGLSPSVPLLHSSFPLGEASLTIVSVAHEKDVNNCSLVILYTYGNTKVIFMGDADQSIEKTIDVDLVGDVDLIKVGHHGSKTSSNKAFIESIHPEYAVITCGEGNKYNHPDQETLETLSTLGLPIYRTDEIGDIVFEVTPQSIKPLQEVPKVEKAQTSKVENSQSAITQKTEEVKQEEEAVEAFKEIQAPSKTIVYYTENGKRYHCNKDCSNMKSPIEGTIDEVGGRTPCQKCYG